MSALAVAATGEPLDAEPPNAGQVTAGQLATEPMATEPMATEELVALPVPAAEPDTEQAAPAPSGLADQPLLESQLRAAVADEPRARERLLAEIHPLVLRYCRARLGRQETLMGSADDVAQEVCLAVVNALPGYTLRGLSFRAFVYGIAAHKVTDAFRAIGRNRAEPVAEIPDSPLVHDGPEHHLLQVELTERLGALLHLLTPRQREVLVLRIAVGLSAEETAHVVGSTPGAVRVTQHRALNRLRRKVVTVGTDADDDGDDAE
jgi:RNA polymerase sigma-70 factor, ECF subfamily